MTRDTPNRGAADCGLVARLSEDALKVNRYFPTLIFSLEVPESEILNAHLIETIYAERERDGTGVRKSNFPELGSWHSHVKLHKDVTFRGIGSIRRRGLGHDVPRARISQVLSTEDRHHVVDHQSTG